MGRRKKNEIVEGLVPPLTLGVGGVGASILGGSVASKLPAGTTNPLTTTGSTLGRFVGPVATISVLGVTTKQLKKVKVKK